MRKIRKLKIQSEIDRKIEERGQQRDQLLELQGFATLEESHSQETVSGTASVSNSNSLPLREVRFGQPSKPPQGITRRNLVKGFDFLEDTDLAREAVLTRKIREKPVNELKIKQYKEFVTVCKVNEKNAKVALEKHEFSCPKENEQEIDRLREAVDLEAYLEKN